MMTGRIARTRESLCMRIENRLLKNMRMRTRSTFLFGLSSFPIVFCAADVHSSRNPTCATDTTAAVECAHRSTFAKTNCVHDVQQRTHEIEFVFLFLSSA
jgi:hypothetical protein